MEEVEKIMTLQEAAVISYNEILDNLTIINEENQREYPNDYAGAYVTESGELVLLLTDLNDIQKYYLNTTVNDVLKFKTVKYSLNYLRSIAFEVINDLGKEYQIIDCFINEPDNSVSITIASEDFKNAAKYFRQCKSKLVGQDAPIGIVESDFQPYVNVVAGNGLKVYRSGAHIGNISAGFGCYNKQVLTVSHNYTFAIGDVIKTTGNTTIGSITSITQQYSLITLSSSHDSTSTALVNSSNSETVRGYYHNLPTDTVILKYGNAYGAASAKVVAHNLGNGMSSAKITNGQVGVGDSGGPVGWKPSTKYFAVGIVEGGASGAVTGVGGTFYFMPINVLPSNLIKIIP
ncbi:S1 family peptidase [Christensenellaceae bacterium OttesenSCG-928-L17]|nr:S1 family peptidase [Christensenellaceae bacterium OttesenSCG-928-L17]